MADNHIPREQRFDHIDAPWTQAALHGLRLTYPNAGLAWIWGFSIILKEKPKYWLCWVPGKSLIETNPDSVLAYGMRFSEAFAMAREQQR